MSIGLVIPCMRPTQVLNVLGDLNKQTMKPDYVLLVDNGGKFEGRDIKYDFQFRVNKPNEGNIGTNAVWNICLGMRFDFVGILADDLRLCKCLLEKSVRATGVRYAGLTTGCVTATVVEELPLPKCASLDDLSGEALPTGKGNAGVILMRREVAFRIPPIPVRKFRIFFGDNWISYHLRTSGNYSWIRLKDCFIYHKSGRNQVSNLLQYKIVLEKERGIWINYWRERGKDPRTIF